jgi:2-methylcitrate dehydratase
VVVTTNDGRTFEEYLEYPKGDPREPMTMDDLENKFNALAGNKFNSNKLNLLKNLIFNCENISSVNFMSQLVID